MVGKIFSLLVLALARGGDSTRPRCQVAKVVSMISGWTLWPLDDHMLSSFCDFMSLSFQLETQNPLPIANMFVQLFFLSEISWATL